ncbi:unnamed protein product [Boreogadus saida]
MNALQLLQQYLKAHSPEPASQALPGLPTIPEASRDESKDSCEDMSCKEDSLYGSPGNNGGGASNLRCRE